LDAYRIVLFLHLCALLAAIGAGSVAHLAQARMACSSTPAEARSWARLFKRLARVFPLSLLALLLTGVYLVHDRWTWSIGWVEASLVGVALLLANGRGVVGRRLQAVGRAPDAEIVALARDPVIHAAAWANTGLAVSIVFVMVDKPGLAGALCAIAVGIAAGALLGRVRAGAQSGA
jgi:hypothetical protein